MRGLRRAGLDFTGRKKPIIIDCDPGADDFLAILLAFASPELEVLGITTVFGNAAVEVTAWNASRACVFAGQTGVRVYPGAKAPLCRRAGVDYGYCGKDGLCDSRLPGDAGLIAPCSALEFLRRTLLAAAEPVTVLSTAAMTNLASLLRQAPELAPKIGEIVTISGYYGLNKAAARGEWNVLLDPEAAQTVFSSGVPVRAVGLDVTSGLRDSFVEELLRDAGGNAAAFIRHTTAYNRARQLAPYSILVDGMAAAAALCPGIAAYESGGVTLDPARTDGGMMCFSAGEGGRSPVLAASRFDFPQYLNLLRERVMVL